MDGAPFNFAAFLALSFARSEALAYARAGCPDLGHILHLQRAGITPDHLLATGLGRAYTEGRVSLPQLLSVIASTEGTPPPQPSTPAARRF